MSDLEPRPTPFLVFIQQAGPPISAWLQRAITHLPLEVVTEITGALDADTPDATINAMLEAATKHCMAKRFGTIDGFWLARAFDTCTQWPIDGEFVGILNGAIEYSGGYLLKQHTREWVLKSGVRFHPKVGNTVTFKSNGSTRSGEVLVVEAGLAQAHVKLFDLAGTKAIVYGEDVESFHA